MSVPTVWVRNPEYCVRECLEVGVTNFVWDKPYLDKKSLDPEAFMRLWCSGQRWRCLIVADREAEAVEIDHHGEQTTHDVWNYGDKIAKLEKLVQANEGTERMVIVMRLPNMRTGIGKQFLKLLDEIQKDYPKSKIHIHALYSWSMLFGMSWHSVDIEPRAAAKGGQVHMPNGKRVKHQRVSEMPEWVTVTGLRVRDLQHPRMRCIFNLKSALWAARHYKEEVKFDTKFKPRGPFAKKQQSKRIFFHTITVDDGDMLRCDTCSLFDNCRYAREGAICAVPGSDVADLATYFNTRNADAVIEGLGELLSSQMGRLQKGMEAEDGKEDFELDPAVTTLFDKIFKDGERLAKLIDPTLVKPGVQISIGQGAEGAAKPNATKNRLIASVVAELEAQGYERHEITPEMVEELLESKAPAALGAGGS